jgi:eukaryotic-like serine/threonine-protein kinase
MPIEPEDFRTGGALQGGIAESLLRQREAQLSPQAGDLVGSYRIIDELGRGGMAIVYRAERADGEYQQQVALKWMLESQSEATSAELFRRERQALADLSHPHVARLLDGGRTSDGRPWFAMELVEGQPLDRHCIEQGLPLAQRLELFNQLCSAVAFAHARGLIHRDIKPSNVLVDGEAQVKLLDFGVAQLLGEDDGLVASAYTPGFASPEQMRGEALTIASDIYQLGRVLDALLRPPEAKSTVGEKIAGKAAGARKVGLSSGLQTDLHAVVEMACSEQPSARHATAAALAQDIRALLERRPVSARPRHARYIASRYLQRHPIAVGASALALSVLLGGTAFFTARLQRERDSANYQARVATSVLEFLREDLLAAADPAAAPGRELSVREALDRASMAADARFADAPIQHGAIRTTLAGLYDQLGRYEEAEREARKAVSLAGASQDSELPRQKANSVLIDVLLSRGKLDQAQTLIDQESGRIPDNGKADARAQLMLLRSRLANLRGDYEGALTLAGDAREILAADAQSNTTIALWATEESATNLQMLGRLDEAMPLLLEIHGSRLARLGPRHPATVLAAHEIGVLKRHQGQYEDALTWLRDALDARSNVLGANHPDTLSSANELATVLQELKRYDEAETLFSRVLESRLTLFGEDHQFTRNSMSNLGLLYSLSGRLEKAAPLYERALTIETRLIGESHPDTIALMHNIAGLYRKQGRLDDALAMHARVLTNAASSLGEDAWQTALFRAGRALTLQAAGRMQEAEVEFSTAIATLEKSLGPEHPRTLRAVQMRDALRAQARASEP